MSHNVIKNLDDWISVEGKFKKLYLHTTETKDNHILWTKTKPYTMRRGSSRKYITVMINRKTIDVMKAYYWLKNGHNTKSSIWNTCGVENCVNPDHMISTDNIRFNNRGQKCGRGHDLTREDNLIYVLRRLRTGEEYRRPMCRICNNLTLHGRPPSRDNRIINSSNINMRRDLTKCKRGHNYTKIIEQGVTRNICKICRAASRKKTRILT